MPTPSEPSESPVEALACGLLVVGILGAAFGTLILRARGRAYRRSGGG